MVAPARIKELADDKGMTMKDFSSFLGVSERTIQNYLSGISLPNGRFLADISEKIGVSLTWILVGRGPKYLSEDHQNLPSLEAKAESRFVPVTHFTAEASAGHGSLVQDETHDSTYAYSRAFLDRRRLKPENLAVISVRGDSMDPDLHDGDKILIDCAEVELDRIKDGQIFVVNFGGALFVKRIQFLPGDGL
ncbi:MAG: helix-turn-helix transcriptional regulator, partial [Paracoccus sp. (in: a-proteobacteria)]